ncbi:recombinase family protein [Streptomyces sp. PanSC9]|uniref:recombinase family protein n=1 Tax=Streptomyces sp. PanSC9 TaxID=1520461 RepID=UPI000F498410|nr:recombinase family protein [Streptomyces sp. PanSC9]ROP53313.1 DNA invertase Pin-like site-specific DNA recombinase [Streptomyces sp. PanSC9]
MKATARARRAGLYIRISDDREGAGLGVKRQSDDCHELAERLGWKIVETYDDNDMSATNRRKKRKGYARLLADIESGHVDAVLAWHPDRLYRQPRELEDLIDLIEANEVDIKTYTAGDLDLSTPTGRMHARMLGAVAKYETEHKAERIKRKVKELVESGAIHNGGHRPFGYERIFEGTGPRRKVIEDRINEAEAKYIRDWARRALEGESLYSLVTDANSRGITTSTGGAWSYQGMKFLLSSGRIAGLKEHKRQVVGKAVWPAIIDEEDHKALRTLLSDRAEQAKANGAQQSSTALKYPLSGLVRCTCTEDGIRMKTSPSSNRKGPVYRCPPKGDGGCGGRTIRIEDLERLMEKLLFAKLEEIEPLDEADPDDPRPALEAKVVKWERRVAELKEELLDGDRPAREIQEAIDTLNSRIAQAHRESAEYGIKGRVLEVSAEELRKAWEDYLPARKQSVYRSLVKEIRIHPATPPKNVWNPGRAEVFWR